MPTKLRKLKITHVAVCRQGANYDADTGDGAHILLFKSAEGVGSGEWGVGKEEITTGDVYTGAGITATCQDPDCDDPDCPVHGAMVRARRKKQRAVDKQSPPHMEPDGDEAPPLDYATRGKQYDLWACLWGKWDCFCTTFYGVVGDADEDNIPHLPILVDSIGQFQADVQQLLEDCGVAKAVNPRLEDMKDICGEALAKAGAAMAGHRRKRLQDAITALQHLLEECTPEDLPHGVQPPVDRAGVNAAEVLGIRGTMKGRAADGPLPTQWQQGDTPMAETAGLVIDGHVAQTTIDALTKRAETAEARVKELEPLVAKTAELETTITKMQQTPEEQEAAYWASVPEAVRKQHEASQAEIVDLRKQRDEALARDEQTTYIAKAAEFRPFGMVPQKHWRLCKAIDKMDDEDRDELLRLMKAAQEQSRTAGLFTAHGSNGSNGATGMEGGSDDDQLMALTQAYMTEKNVDFLKASEAIAKQHPALYQRARAERQRSTRVSSD